MKFKPFTDQQRRRSRASFGDHLGGTNLLSKMICVPSTGHSNTSPSCDTRLAIWLPFLLWMVLFCATGCNVHSDDSLSGTARLPCNIAGERTDAGMWLIEWFTNNDALSYAVINGPSPGEALGHVRASGDSSGRMSATLRKPDGTEIPILGTGRVFQVSGSNVTETSMHISAAAFTAFLEDHRSDYSLSAVEKFAKEFEVSH